jgi:hypothetical protein
MPPTAPPAPVPVAPAALEADPFTVAGPFREETLPLLKGSVVDPKTAQLLSPPPGVPPAPAACDAFAARKGAGALKCAPGLDGLDAAFAEPDRDRRDALLADLEPCNAFPAGLIRALRAEVAPAECADALVAPFLKTPPPSLGGPIYMALVGQALAARLGRTATTPPRLDPPFERKRVLEFLQGPIATWMSEAFPAIDDMSRSGVSLVSYGKGVAAVEAGMADIRVVEAVRSAPIPDEIGRDPELRSEYYGALDQKLDPRKDRGRDAALVGLRELAVVGVLRDARVGRARTLLSQLYGGRRIDALDALLLPPLPAASPASAEERLAARLPTFYAGLVLDPQAATRPGTLRALLEKGVPLPQRAALAAASPSPATRALFARARLELGMIYWRAVDFDQAAALAAQWPAGEKRPDDVTFVLAVALALRGGVEDATELVRKAPLTSLGLGPTAALDALARGKPATAYAGMAAFDAALIKQIAAPQGADAAYFKDVADRFHAAAALLGNPAQKALAEEHASAAAATAAALH